MMRHDAIHSPKAVVFGLALLLFAGLAFVGCGEHPALPTAIENKVEDFGANDTSFVRISPDWDAANGYTWTNPTDILIGPDGFVYVVDFTEVDGGSNGRVVQLTTTGSVVRNSLFTSVTDTSNGPRGIGQDTKLNLYMVNGTDKIYCWNQYVAQVGVQELVQTITLANPETEDTIRIDNTQPLYLQLGGANTADYIVVDYTSTTEPDSLTPLTAPYLFYVDHTYAVGTLTKPKIVDIAGGAANSNKLYYADEQDDRIVEINVLPSRILLLNNGVTFYAYVGTPSAVAVGAGQGQGSVNSPTSLVTQGGASSTSILFSQTAGNFRVQRVSGAGSNWHFDIAVTEAGEPELLMLDYFDKPMSVAVGERDARGLGLIYVADQAQNRVTAFFPSGFKFREVAIEPEFIDLQAGQSLDDYLAQRGDELDAVLNPDLVDFYAARDTPVSLDSAQSLVSILLSMGISYSDLLDPPVGETYIAPQDTTFDLSVAADSTVKVLWPILDGPAGVATAEGVVYISDTGNNRLLRYIRTDANTYLPKTQQ